MSSFLTSDEIPKSFCYHTDDVEATGFSVDVSRNLKTPNENFKDDQTPTRPIPQKIESARQAASLPVKKMAYSTICGFSTRIRKRNQFTHFR